MSVVPNTKSGKLEFYESHIEGWVENAADIGVQPSQLTALSALIAAARTSYTAQQVAADAARDATGDSNLAISAMHKLGSATIAQIRAFAETTNNPGVFTLASLPFPADPSPVGPPGKPSDLEVSILIGGSLHLRWKCENPPNASGTVYEVRRRIGGGSFVIIGAAGGNKEFIDATLPGGSTGVVYEITGMRTGLRGLSNQFNVNFGVGGAGITVTAAGDGVKMAA